MNLAAINLIVSLITLIVMVVLAKYVYRYKKEVTEFADDVDQVEKYKKMISDWVSKHA